jgi:hypothetical protein
MSSIFQNLVRLLIGLAGPSDPAIAERGIVVVDASWETLGSDFLSAPPHRPVVSGVTTLQLP